MTTIIVFLIFGEKLCKPKVLQIIATRAIFEFIKVLKNGKFTIPDNVKQETERYFMQDNNALEFCNLFPIKTIVSKTSYYQKYDDWCHKNLDEPLNKVQFGKQVIALGNRADKLNFKGDRILCYASPSFENASKPSIYQDFKRQNDVSDLETYLCKQFDDEAKVDDTQNTEDEQTIDNEQNTQEAQSTENEETTSDNT